VESGGLDRTRRRNKVRAARYFAFERQGLQALHLGGDRPGSVLQGL
jgi:hypothetical protein